MPLLTSDESPLLTPTAPAPAPLPVAAHSQVLKPIFTDTTLTPRDALLTYAEGARWKVRYYAQLLGADSALSGQQVSLDGTYQSYTEIVGLVLCVQQPLTGSQDSETKAQNYTGSARFLPGTGFIPNAGDMFVADIGQGRTGVFRVTDSDKKSLYNEACYEISYGLDTDEAVKAEDLIDKTTATYYFKEDFLTYGTRPLLAAPSAQALLELEGALATLAGQYFQRFFSREYQTLLVPGQPAPTYDPFVVDYLLRAFSVADWPQLVQTQRYNVDEDLNCSVPQLWTLLAKRDASLLPLCFTQSGLVLAQSFDRQPVFNGIRYAGVKYVVYPTNAPNVRGYESGDLKTPLPQALTPSPVEDVLNVMVQQVNQQALPSAADSILPVTTDAYYVLSQAFYQRRENQSVLEALVWDFLERRPLDAAQLLQAARQCWHWGLVEQFYYIPILWTLGRAALRGA